MALTLTIASKDARNDAITALVDLGATNAAGKFRLKTTGGTPLVDIELANPAFGASVSGVSTLNGTPLSGTAVSSGDAATFDILDRDNTVIYSGTVSLAGGGGDAVISPSLTIQVDDTVNLNSHSIQ